MKYLSNYVEDGLSKAFEEHGAFFAFNRDQFDEQAEPGVEYFHLRGGLICPKDKVDALIDQIMDVTKKGILQDIEENGLEAIVERELSNHECTYTGRWQDAYEKLHDYPGISEELVKLKFNTMMRDDCA